MSGGDVVLGIRPHSGWAVVVAVAPGPPPRLVARERIEVLADGDPKQPWHAAQDGGLSAADAAALADRVAAGATDAAGKAIAALVQATGGDVRAAAVIGEPQDLPPAERILASHPLLHTAEGDLFWTALADGCAACGLDVVAVPAKSIDVDPHTSLLADMGRAAGPPWRVDHRLAVVAALTATR
jgi:hypothetical protein